MVKLFWNKWDIKLESEEKKQKLSLWICKIDFNSHNVSLYSTAVPNSYETSLFIVRYLPNPFPSFLLKPELHYSIKLVWMQFILLKIVVKVLPDSWPDLKTKLCICQRYVESLFLALENKTKNLKPTATKPTRLHKGTEVSCLQLVIKLLWLNKLSFRWSMVLISLHVLGP